jgi:hypothetical protein
MTIAILRTVVPAQAGTHAMQAQLRRARAMGPRLRGDDGGGATEGGMR